MSQFHASPSPPPFWGVLFVSWCKRIGSSWGLAGPPPHLLRQVQLGIAYLALPKTVQPKPKIFHLNVGHLENDEDFIRTGEATAKMLQSLGEDSESGKKGMCPTLLPGSFVGTQRGLVIP